MATITLRGNEVHTNGEPPAIGTEAPAFKLTTASLEDVGLDAWAGKRKIVSVSPSLDTGICAASARAFNEKAASMDNTVVLVVTSDLPFAQKRFCETEGIENVVTLSPMRSRAFAKDWGLLLTDGPMAGLTARCVLVLDEKNVVRYVQLVPEIATEPDYDAALAALA